MAMEQRNAIAAGVLGAAAVLAAFALVSRQYPTQVENWWQLACTSVGALSKSSRKRGAPDPAAGGCEYDWAQSYEEVLVEVKLPAGTSAAAVSVRLEPTRLRVMLGRQCAVCGQLGGRIMPADSSWSIGGRGDSRVLSITLTKAHKSDASLLEYEIWDSLLQQQQQEQSVVASPQRNKRSGVYLDQLSEPQDVRPAADQFSRL